MARLSVDVGGGVDSGVLQQAGLGAGHAVEGAAEHGLNGRVGGIGEGVFNRSDLAEVGLVGGHPAADAGGELVEALDDQRAAGVFSIGAGAVEGEDEGVAEVLYMSAEPEGRGVGEVGASEELGGDFFCPEGAGDRAVGADEDGVWVEAEQAQDAHGEAVTASGGDDKLDSAGLGCAEGGEVARADAAVVAEQGAVHVDCDEADGVVVSCCRQVAPEISV